LVAFLVPVGILRNIPVLALVLKSISEGTEENGAIAERLRAFVDGLGQRLEAIAGETVELREAAGRTVEASAVTAEMAAFIDDTILSLVSKVINHAAVVVGIHDNTGTAKSNTEKLNTLIESQAAAVVESSSAIEE